MMKKLLFSILTLTSLISFCQEAYYSDVNLQLSGTDLKDALATKIISTHTNLLSYTPGVWEASKVTDKDVDASRVVLIYGWENGTDQDITNDRTRDNSLQDRGNGDSFVWNREHVFSKSLANPSLVTNNPGPGTDAHNLRPADKNRNSERNNYKFALGTGNSSRSSITYNGPEGANTRGWYPGDEWKGDVARIIMYMYLRYGDQCLPTAVGVGSNQFTPDDMIDLFLKWNAEDPVSDFEKARNTFHENTSNTYAQGNRNPFIDNPYLATRIWGGDSAQDTWGIYTSSDTQAPTKPTNVTLSNITLTSIDLNWTASTDDVGVTGYNVYVNNVLTKQTTTTNTSITGLEAGTSYSFKVIAKDQINSSEASDVVTGQTLSDTTAPTVPSNVTVTNVTDSSFMVNWSASTDNNAVASYDVYLDDTFHANTTDTNYTIINLATSTTYSVSVLAKDKDNNMSAKSAAVSATTTDGSSGGTATELFISEYVEGDGGTNKAIEIVNLTGSTVDLDGYVLKLERNGSGVWTTPLALDKGSVKSIVPGDVFVVGNGDNSAPELQPYSASNPNGQVDLVQPNNFDTNYGQPVNFNGDDAVALFKDDVLIDMIGVFGNGAQFAINVTLRRNGDITAPNTTFDKTGEWTAFPENTFNGIGSHTVTLSTNSETLNGFKMYPNPVTGNKLFFNINEKATINIYNVLGKLVQSETIENVNSSINVSKLSKGMYLLKLNTQNQSITKKFIKQ
ncbi:endonuclease [Polaribacter sp. KT 15]|uniref:endonuclease n=1 Tax=Polaribacter sp. KT 15 TaxID=1896175 RepID=UPI00090C924D|nr:endonuclease [Polaribacter sp. KT 15]SHN05840.1 Por secretion system C-terminal sorting domain-containing protein [Polaribacter sp. KT 15]